MTLTPGRFTDAPPLVEEAVKACIDAWVHNDMKSARDQAWVILYNLDLCPGRQVGSFTAWETKRVASREIFIFRSYGLSAADDGGKPTLTLYTTPMITRQNTVVADEEWIPDWEFSLNQEGRMEFHPHPRSEQTSQFLKSLRHS